MNTYANESQALLVISLSFFIFAIRNFINLIIFYFKSENVCIPNDMIGDNEYELTGLTPGNYMIRLRATSLAGVGPWTSYSHFIV